VIILIAIWAVYSFAQSSTNPSQPSQVTSTVISSSSNSIPDFTLPEVGPNGLTGQSVTFSSFHGRVILLEFMESNCPHCEHMAPILSALYSQYGNNVVFISIVGPWNGVTLQDTENFIRAYGVTWTTVYDSSGIVFSNYGIQATPTFFIISRDGLVSSTFQGEQTLNTMTGAISAAMG